MNFDAPGRQYGWRWNRVGYGFASWIGCGIASTAIAQFPANVDLGGLASPTGVKINGTIISAQAGYDVAGVGDLTGDGLADLVLGAPYQQKPGGEQAGAALVVYGSPSLTSLSTLNAIQTSPAGYYVRGRQAFDNLGWSVAAAGDINADGKMDFLVGAPNAESGSNFGNEGEAYLIYGRTAGLPSIVEISALTPAIGVRIRGARTDGKCGEAVAGIGDFDGDGIPDIAVGAPGAGTPTVRVPAPVDVYDVAIGDVTGDGIVDVVATHHGPDQISIAQGIGGGAFTPGVGISTFVPDNDMVELVDADLDGDLDLILGGDNGAGTQCIVARLLNFGTGIFSFPTTIHTGYPLLYTMDFADADADGDPDLLVVDKPAGNTQGQATIVYNTFVAGISGTVPLAVSTTGLVESGVFADLQNDGLMESVVTEHVANSITVYADSAGGNTPGQTFTLTSTPRAHAAFDLEGDGDIDVGIVAPGIRMLTNSGAGVMSLTSSLSTNVGIGASFGDFDGDNRLDLVDVGVTSNTAARVFRNAGNGTFETAKSFTQDAALLQTRVGDLNADGRDDVLLVYPPSQTQGKFGVCLAVENGCLPGQKEGRAYVVRGSSPALAAGDVNLAALTSADGFEIRGSYGGAQCGSSLDSPGDVNGDGYSDLLVGMLGAHTESFSGGSAYLVFGSSALAGGGPFELETLAASSKFAIHGTKPSGGLGVDITGGGDIDADGVPDIAIGAPYATLGGVTESGYVAVVRGTAALPGVETTDAALLGPSGFRVLSNLPEQAGTSVDFGDLNDDGISDLFFGSDAASPNGNASGRAHVIYGGVSVGASGVIDQNTLSTSQGIRFNGATALDRVGFSIASAGDLDGNGRDDLVISAPTADPNGSTSAGTTYLIHGKPNALGGDKTVISLAVGGSQSLYLRAGIANAGKQYVILGSMTGVTPGVNFGITHFPLNIDVYTTIVATYFNTFVYTGFLGSLDANGNASASFNLPPGITGVPPHLLLHHAYLVLNPAQFPIFASNAYPIYLDP